MRSPSARRSRRRFTPWAVDLLEPRMMLSAGYVPSLFVPDENPTSMTLGSYPPNVVRRFDPASGNLVSTVTATFTGLHPAPWSRPADAIIDGSLGTNFDLLANPGVDPMTTQLVVTVDLHKTFRLREVYHEWSDGRYPLTYIIQGSIDGTRFSDLVGPTPGTIRNLDTFAPADVRFLRLVGLGVTTQSELNLGEILAFIDANAAPLSTADGLDVTYEQSGPTVTDETPGAWGSFDMGPKLASALFTTGRPGATADASGLLDLGRIHRSIGLNIIFDNYLSSNNDVWQNGGTIQVRSDPGEPWRTVYDTSGPMTTVTLNWAAAPQMICYVRFVNKFGTYPAGQSYAGQAGTGTGRLAHIEVVTATEEPFTPKPIGTIVVPSEGTLSAAVYNDRGTLVRTLAQARSVQAGPFALYWDGTDDNSAPVDTSRDYTVRTLFNQARSSVVTAVGDSGTPGDTVPPLNGDTTAASGGIGALAVDPSGYLYTGSGFEEGPTELRKLTPDGKYVWNRNGLEFDALATDGIYVFAASDNGASSTVYRFRASDGSFAWYDGTFNSSDASGSSFTPVSSNSAPSSAGDPTSQYRDARAVLGMAVEVGGAGLFLANYHADRIEIWNKLTGQAINSSALSLDDPVGIAVDPRGRAIWVAYGGDRVSKFVYDPATYRIDPTPAVTISGLQDPYGVAVANLGTVGAPDYHLYVTERGRSKIRECDIDGPAPINTGRFADFGQPYTPGPLAADEFGWQLPTAMPAIAVADGGIVTVADAFNRRLQRFHQDGSLYQSMFKEYVPSPWVDPASVTADTHDLLSGGFEYQVDVAGGTYADGMADHTWRLAANWTPADGAFFTSTFFSPTKRLTLDVNRGTGLPPLYRTFLFNRNSGRTEGMVVYAVEGGATRRAAIVGDFWTGATDALSPAYDSWTWTDRDGDGQVDDAEVSRLGAVAWGWGQMGTIDVDDQGNLWVSNGSWLGRQPVGNAIYKIPLAGFEKVPGQDRYNPIYRFADAQLIVSCDSMRDPEGGQQFAYIAKPTPDGGVLALTHTHSTGAFPTIRLYDAKGQQRFAYPVLTRSAVNTIATDPDPTSGFFYDANAGGEMHWIDLRDADGLAIVRITGENSGWGSNWIDNNAGVSVFVQGGKRYVYAEDVYLGKSNLYRIDGLETVRRGSFTFSWPGFADWSPESPPRVSLADKTPPTLDPIPDVTIPENAEAREVGLTGLPTGPYMITATSDNPGLVPNPLVTSAGSGPTAVLILRPTANASGTARIRVAVKDEGGSAGGELIRTFTLTVTPTNRRPVVSPDAYEVDDGRVLPVPAESGVLANDSDADHDPFRSYSSRVHSTECSRFRAVSA